MRDVNGKVINVGDRVIPLSVAEEYPDLVTVITVTDTLLILSDGRRTHIKPGQVAAVAIPDDEYPKS